VGSPLRSLRTIGRRLSAENARRCKFTDSLFSAANSQLQSNLFLHNPACIQFADEILAVLAIVVASCMAQYEAETGVKVPSIGAANDEKKVKSSKPLPKEFKVKSPLTLQQYILEIIDTIEESKVRVGDQVEVVSSGWSRGVIAAETGNETFSIRFDDGLIEENVLEERIRRQHFVNRTSSSASTASSPSMSSVTSSSKKRGEASRKKYFRHVIESATRLQKQTKHEFQKGEYGLQTSI